MDHIADKNEQQNSNTEELRKLRASNESQENTQLGSQMIRSQHLLHRPIQTIHQLNGS